MSLNQRLQIWQKWKLHLIKLVNFQQNQQPLSFQFSGFEKAIRNMHLANAITKFVNKFCHKLLKQWVSNKLQILRKIPFVILQMHLDFLLSYLPSFKILKENKYRETSIQTTNTYQLVLLHRLETNLSRRSCDLCVLHRWTLMLELEK